jgi:hypothetical protein
LQLPRSGGGSRAARKVVHQFLEADESRLLNLLQVRIRILGSDSDDTDQNAEPQDEFAGAERLANKLMDETIEDLNAVRKSSISKAPRK